MKTKYWILLWISLLAFSVWFVSPESEYPRQFTIVRQKTNEFYHGENWGYTFDNYGCIQAGFSNKESVVREIADMKARQRAQAWEDFKAKFRKKKKQHILNSWDVGQ